MTICDGEILAISATLFVPSITVREGSSDVEGTFARYDCPVETSNRSISVNVPTTSTLGR